MIATYLARAIVVGVVAWYLGQAIADQYVEMASTVHQYRERMVGHAFKR